MNYQNKILENLIKKGFEVIPASKPDKPDPKLEEMARNVSKAVDDFLIKLEEHRKYSRENPSDVVFKYCLYHS